MSDEEKHHSSRSRKVEGRTELDLVKDEVKEAKRLLEEAHVEVQTAKKKVPEASVPCGQEDKSHVEKWCAAILKLQGSKDIKVQCVDFCGAMTSKVHAVLQHALFDLRGGTFRQHPRVLVATVVTKRSHTSACTYSMLPCSRFLEVHTHCSECWPSRRVRRFSGFLTKSNDSRVCLSWVAL